MIKRSIITESTRDMFEELGDQAGLAAALFQLGIVAKIKENGVSAREFMKRALAIQRRLGDQNGTAFTLATLGYVAHEEGNQEESRRCWKQSLAIAERIHIPLEEELRSWLGDSVDG